jgi:hypothetical protein
MGTGDPEILRIAIAEGRAVLTRNRRHFMRLHMQQPNHAGIIVCTVDSNFERQAQRIHSAISMVNSLEGLLIRVNRPGPAETDA